MRQNLIRITVSMSPGGFDSRLFHVLLVRFTDISATVDSLTSAVIGFVYTGNPPGASF